MKTQKQVDKYFDKKSSSKKSKSQNKFKNKSQIIIEQYRKPEIPEDKLYMIDKVARLRAKEGRFGIDHSEILNFEFEMANKNRDDHMNHLVYKNTLSSNRGYNTSSQTEEWDKENSYKMLSSQTLLQRLS